MDTNSLHEKWIAFRAENRLVSLDRMLCDPVLRHKFLEHCCPGHTHHDEFDILWGLMALRKRKQLAPKKST